MSVIFLDIDGTYASHGAVPDKHVEAVQRARANGHRVLLCTGRARSCVSPRLLQAGFDGVVCGAGAYVEVGGEVLHDESFPRGLADRTVDVLLAHEAHMMIESTEGLFMLPEAAAAMDTRAPAAGAAHAQAAVWQDLLAARRVVDDLHGLNFAKILTVHASADLLDIAALIGDEVTAVGTSIQDVGRGAGELYLAHITKAVGISIVLEHLDLTPADAVGAGDGPNDREMMELVGTAIAIEGGHPDVLAAADIVVPGPEQAGLAQAFATLGLS